MIPVDRRIQRATEVTLGLRAMGLSVRDALIAGAHLENAEHPFDEQRWPWLTKSEMDP